MPPAALSSERCYQLGLTHCRWFIADDRGMVCPRDSLNYGTGCCTDGEQHACTRCCAVLLSRMFLLARSLLLVGHRHLYLELAAHFQSSIPLLRLSFCSCQVDDKCCSQYEYCVSCCLKPENKPEQHMGSLFRGRNK